MTRADIEYILSSQAVRERCAQLRKLAEQDSLDHFILVADKLDDLVDNVHAEIVTNYPKLTVPFHSRWRHFSVGGVDRESLLDRALTSQSLRERCRAKIELAIVSVLLDAGAGSDWCFVETPGGPRYQRSEGLAVASFHGFVGGLFGTNPYSVSGTTLCSLTVEELGKALQVSTDNPLLGMPGRVELLNRLGQVVLSQSRDFQGSPGRLGGVLEAIESLDTGEGVRASTLLSYILKTLGPIWPGRIAIDGQNLGDVWRHSKIVGEGGLNTLLPLHKLSQWLTYSLLEPLQEAGVVVTHLNELTGLAEYRNGGLFIDAGVLELRDAHAATISHSPSSELIVEWRGLTVSLLDSVAEKLREKMGLSEHDFPLAKVLQGGTWSLGRKMAAERRPHAAPPLTIVSDGTVF